MEEIRLLVAHAAADSFLGTRKGLSVVGELGKNLVLSL